LRVDRAGDIGNAIRMAIAANRPYLIDVNINADQNPGGGRRLGTARPRRQQGRNRRAVPAKISIETSGSRKTNGGPHSGRGQELQTARPRFVGSVGRRLDRRDHKGFAYVGAGRQRELQRPRGFTVHDVRDPREAEEGRRGEVAAWRAIAQAPRGRRRHSLRATPSGSAARPGATPRTGLFIFDISKGGEPKQIGFYDTPGNGPHRFGVDNKRKLAFLPNAAQGWKNRVIWTLDIKDPTKPEVISQFGLPWMKDTASDGDRSGRPSARRSVHPARPAVIRGNRMYCAWWGGGISVIDCSDLRNMKLVGHSVLGAAVPRLQPHLLAARRPALSDLHRRGARQAEILGRAVHVGDRRPQGGQARPDRDLHAGPREVFNRPGRYGAHNILEHLPADGRGRTSCS
jgi:hypothetical protein